MTLLDTWESMPPPGPSDGTDWVQQQEDSSTLGARAQLLGPHRRRTILDAILGNLCKDRVRQQAARIAEIYNHMAEQDTPQTMVTLRVAFKQRQPDRGGQAVDRENEGQPSSSSDETDKESKGASAGGGRAVRREAEAKSGPGSGGPRGEHTALPPPSEKSRTVTG